MLSDIPPFRLAGNTYFVGTYKASSHLIDTGNGLILIDTGYASTADVILESMQILGFDIADVKLILHSHGHYDHTEGTAKLLKLCHAKTYLHAADMRYVRNYFTPDVFFHDGDVIRLGNTEITVLETPGHTAGTVSFFWNVEEGGKTYRAAMFGGAGTPQMKKDFLKKRGLSYLLRGEFLKSIERLRGCEVDIFIGNHANQNDTKGNYEKSLAGGANPFIDSARWGKFLDERETRFLQMLREEWRTTFVNYAHRGASEYYPENTMSSFDAGIAMGANGIETDVQITKEGVPVLFHDDTITRVTGGEGSIGDYTWDELQNFDVKKGERTDKIVKFEDFLDKYADLDLTFAIELKQAGTAEIVADIVRRRGIARKCVITSFKFNELCALRAYAPELTTGYLTSRVDDGIIAKMLEIGIDELCPKADLVTPESVAAWHRLGFNVRAWGVANTDLMQNVYDSFGDGMTVNFPDKLTEYIGKKQ